MARRLKTSEWRLAGRQRRGRLHKIGLLTGARARWRPNEWWWLGLTG